MNTEQIGKALRRDKALRKEWRKIIADAIRSANCDSYGYESPLVSISPEHAAEAVLDALFGAEKRSGQ